MRLTDPFANQYSNGSYKWPEAEINRFSLRAGAIKKAGAIRWAIAQSRSSIMIKWSVRKTKAPKKRQTAITGMDEEKVCATTTIIAAGRKL